MLNYQKLYPRCFLQDHTGCHQLFAISLKSSHSPWHMGSSQVFQMRDPKNISKKMLAFRRTKTYILHIRLGSLQNYKKATSHSQNAGLNVIKKKKKKHFFGRSSKHFQNPPQISHPQITSSKFKKCNKSELGTSPFCFLGSKRNSPVASSKNMHAALHTLNTFWRNGKLTI